MVRKRKVASGTERSRVSPHLKSINYLGKSTVTAKELQDLADVGWLTLDRAERPGPDETTPHTREGYVIVFQRFFDGGLHFSCVPFIGEVL